MAKCDMCGKKGILITTYRCFVCGNNMCSNCYEYVFVIGQGIRYVFDYSEPLYVCGKDCADKIRDYIFSDFIDSIGTKTRFTTRLEFERLFERKIMEFVEKKYPDPFCRITWTGGGDFWIYIPATSVFNQLRERFETSGLTLMAGNLEEAGHFETAAEIWEELGDYRRAGMLRKKERTFYVKQKNVAININSLLDRIKEEGIVAVFRCPHCKAKLKIDDKTTDKSIRVCEYCDTEIDTIEIADFLKTVLD